jgi:hydroxypyruvate reductase
MPPGAEALARLRADALAVFRAGVAAADPTALVAAALRISPAGRPIVAGDELRAGAALRVVAIGKAAPAMAAAAAAKLPGNIFPGPGVAVVNRENERPVERFRILAAGHPIPDEAGAEAAREVERHAGGARAGDGLIVLLSGGASALLPAPAAGLGLADKVAVTDLLLRSGAGIGELNTVRKHLSRLKGGGLARLARPAAVETLILSDVIGDDPSTIASGPTAPDPTTFEQALAILERRGLLERVPRAVRERLERGARGEEEETPKPGDVLFARVRNRILGSNSLSLDAARKEAEARGYAARLASRALTGEAREAALLLARPARGAAGAPSGAAGRDAILSGGETTVTVRGGGRGGRNQELALAFALEAERAPLTGAAPWVFLSAGTDGIDGPTDAAGAVVDEGTLERGRRAGLDPRHALEENDSYAFLERAGDLIRTGATGTNVADLQVFLQRRT